MILISDLHLTDNPQDEYRWGVLPWVKEQAVKRKCSVVLILGDLTDQKDKHSSKLVNRLSESLLDLSSVCEVVILRGNHDCMDPNEPFFEFLKNLGNVSFVVQPETVTINKKKLLFLPHSRQPEIDWADLKFKGDFIFMHQTMNGSMASNGFALPGSDETLFKKLKGVIYSGDIHVPQTLGKITYVGSPYRIKFGDNFTPRAMLLKKDGKTEDLHYPCLVKHKIIVRDPERIYSYKDINPGDQVKVDVELSRSDFVDWAKHKKRVSEICSELQVSLHGCKLIEKRGGRPQLGEESRPAKETVIRRPSADILQTYAKREKIGAKLIKVGLDLVSGPK